MNFYNPYFSSLPTTTGSSLLSKINISSIINGTSKTLNLINQAIPVIKQVSPIMKNAKTMFNIMNEFRKADPTIQNNTENIVSTTKNNIMEEKNGNYPTFFI